jgi:ribosomal protein S18 acetylase RimI-like enzyme
MADVTLRAASASDAPDVRDLVYAAYSPYLARMSRRPAPMDQDYAEVLRSADCWVAEADGEIVGVVVTRARPDHLLIENLAVRPDAQGRGIGALLLGRAEEHARACGLGEVRLYTNEVMTENLAFYPARGYRETGRAEHEGFRRVFFAKPAFLTPASPLVQSDLGRKSD